MEVFYQSLFHDILVPVVSWALAAHLVFPSYVYCLQNPFKAPEITESDEEAANGEGVFIDVEDDEDICVD